MLRESHVGNVPLIEPREACTLSLSKGIDNEVAIDFLGPNIAADAKRDPDLVLGLQPRGGAAIAEWVRSAGQVGNCQNEPVIGRIRKKGPKANIRFRHAAQDARRVDIVEAHRQLDLACSDGWARP